MPRGDGLLRSTAGKGEVLVHGQRCPIVGRISMDLATVDVTGIEGLRLGDEVTLLGSSGPERIRAEEVAATLGTIPYALLCSLGKRVRRIAIPADVERDPPSLVPARPPSGPVGAPRAPRIPAPGATEEPSSRVAHSSTA